jgi:hypothetical protein
MWKTWRVLSTRACTAIGAEKLRLAGHSLDLKKFTRLITCHLSLPDSPGWLSCGIQGNRRDGHQPRPPTFRDG